MSGSAEQPSQVNRAGWVAISVASLGAALFACFIALVWNTLGEGDGSSLMLVWPLVGLIPAFALLIRAIDGNGHPWRWLAATIVIYGTWYLIFTGATL